MKADVMIIDGQNDFILPNAPLEVKGAVEDSERTAAMISRLGDKIHKVYATFDSHVQYQIFHPMFWINVTPGTLISHDDILSGKVSPIDPNMRDWTLSYTKSLEEGGRYPLIVWPYHCLIGTPGWCMEANMMAAIHQWERDTYRSFRPITKGSNFKTEHYSAVKAEVEVPEDVTTQLNFNGFIAPLEKSDMIIMMGQAKSHCLANTARDIMKYFSNPEYVKKMYICEDATSSVGGFEHLGDEFFDEFLAAGGNITTTDKILR